MKISILTILILIAIIQPVYTSSSADLIDFQGRWALLIGVGQYPEESGIEQLKSPGNDVKTMRQMLIQYGGFSAEHIIILPERQATYRGVNEAFQTLRNRVQPEDLVVFYFSGPGNNFPTDWRGDFHERRRTWHDAKALSLTNWSTSSRGAQARLLHLGQQRKFNPNNPAG